jgi:hypothetical protein
MYAGVLAYRENWFAPLAFLPLASLLYGIIALSAGITTPTADSSSSPAIGGRGSVRSPVRFTVFVGLLVLAMLGGGAVLLLPNVQPANTGPSAGPALEVTESSATADCANGVYPSVTLTNTSAQTLQWTAKSEDPNVAASPVQGSLAPFATAQVAFTGKTAAADVIVQFASGGGDGVAKFGCQPGTSK